MKTEFDQKDLILSKLTLDFISEMIFWIDSEGKFFMVNEAACKKLGYTQEELTRLSVPDIDKDNSIEFFFAKWEEISKKGVKSFEVSLETKSNDYFLAEITANFAEFEGQKYLCAVVRDISERKEVEDTLIASEERYRTLFENANDTIFIMDQDVFVDCNQKGVEMFGYSEKKDIIGHSPWDFSPHKQPDGTLTIKKAKDFVKEAMTGEPLTFYWRHVRKNGEEFDADVTLSRMVIREKVYLLAICRDKTEEMAALNALKESEEKFLRSFNNNPSSLHITTIPDGKFVEVNSLFEKLSGYTKEELIGRSSVEMGFYVNDKDRDNLFKELQEKGRLVDYEISFKVKSGEHLLCRVFSEIVEMSGKPHLVSHVKDITDNKKAEEEIAHQKFRLDNIIKGTRAGTWEWNIQTGETIFNEEWAHIIGYTLEELSPVSIETWMKYVHPDDLEESNRLLESHFKGESDSYYFECRMKHKSGKWVWVLDRGKVATWTKDGRPTWMFGTHQDITERKQTEEALRISEDRLSKIMRAANDGMWDWDLKTNDVFFDPRYYEMAGYSADEFPHRLDAFQERVHPEDIGEVMAQAEKHLKNETKRFDVEFRFRRKSGDWMWIAGRGIIVERDEKGTPLRFVGTHQDITERKEAEKQLEKTRGLLQAAIEQTPAGILIADAPDGNIRIANNAALGIRGESDKPLTDIPISKHPQHWQTYHPDGTPFKPEDLPLSRAILKGEVSANVDAIIQSSDGTKRWVLANASPVLNKEGEVIAGVVVFPDVTEQKEAEAALKESEEKFRTMAEASPDAVTITDMEAKITFASLRTSEMHGYVNPSELIGLNAFDLLSTEEREEALKKFQFGIEKGELRDVVFTLLRKDGSTFPGELTGSVLKDKEGNPVGSIIISRDITQRKLAEKALVESEERYRLLIENAPTVAWKTTRNNRTTFVSSNVENVYGYTPAEIYEGGKGLFISRVHPDEQPMVEKSFNQLFEKGLEYDVEYRIQRKDGSWIWIQDRSNTVREEDGIQYAYGVFSDITDRKKAEEEIKSYQKDLQSMSAELNLAEEKERRRIAINLHDHLSQSLAMAKIKLTGLKKENLTDKIYETIEETNRFITDAIENSRSITYELSPPVLYELGLVPAIQWYLDKMEVEHAVNTKLSVMGELPKLEEDRQILIFRSVSELLNNVVKHADASLTQVSLKVVDNLVKIAVKDNGRGIILKQKTKLGKGEGGFGLFSIRERLGYFNGKLEIVSEKGKGTEIIISIPVKS